VKTNKLILGDGLLGSELVKQTGWDYISRKKDNFNLEDIESYIRENDNYDEIINCIAHTDTYSDDSEKHLSVNFDFVVNLVKICNQTSKKYIHISTDYVYTHSKPFSSEKDVPVHLGTWYGYSKLLADGYVQRCSYNHLVCRSTHKEKPFKYDKAWTNQYGNFDYVDKQTERIIHLIENDKNGLYNIGGELTTMYLLGKKTRDVLPDDTIKGAPTDVTMNINKLKRCVNDKEEL
tara:strand:- start:879 stop:1580 length:702 start_codon:yes stop_codon:yes gene_type:complete